jgi:hypothetical protein
MRQQWTRGRTITVTKDANGVTVFFFQPHSAWQQMTRHRQFSIFNKKKTTKSKNDNNLTKI